MRSTFALWSVTMMLPVIRLTAILPSGDSTDFNCSSNSSQNLMLSDLVMETLVLSPPPAPAPPPPPPAAPPPPPPVGPPPPLAALELRLGGRSRRQLGQALVEGLCRRGRRVGRPVAIRLGWRRDGAGQPRGRFRGPRAALRHHPFRGRRLYRLARFAAAKSKRSHQRDA